MQFKQINSNTFLIRLERGEYIVKSLKDFCQKNKIEGGFFSGIGAVKEVELALYDVGKKKYFSEKFREAFELTNLTGTIGIDISTQKNQGLIIHAHATLADNRMNTKGGHLVDARISGTAEIYLKILPKLEKNFDDKTGLKLFNL